MVTADNTEVITLECYRSWPDITLQPQENGSTFCSH